MRLDTYDLDPDAEDRRARIKAGFDRLIAALEARQENDQDSALNRHRRAVAKANAWWDQKRSASVTYVSSEQSEPPEDGHASQR